MSDLVLVEHDESRDKCWTLLFLCRSCDAFMWWAIEFCVHFIISPGCYWSLKTIFIYKWLECFTVLPTLLNQECDHLIWDEIVLIFGSSFNWSAMIIVSCLIKTWIVVQLIFDCFFDSCAGAGLVWRRRRNGYSLRGAFCYLAYSYSKCHCWSLAGK